MKKQLMAIVLGGTSAHIDLINKLKDRNYYTILIDYYENPIAKSYADEHIQESTLDKEKILEIAKKREVDLVITTSIDQANVTAMYVLGQLGLHRPYDYETALDVTNKIRMKEKMVENEIPTSKYILIDNLKSYDVSELEYPLIVKPADSNGSKGVNRVNEPERLHEKIIEAFNISRSKEVVVEEYKNGIEVGIDCCIVDYDTTILTIRERRKITNNNKESLQQILGTITPTDIGSEMENKIKEIVDKIAKVFKLKDTPLMIQAILSSDEINIIEFAPRIGGGESSKLIKRITGFDIIDGAIKSFLDEPIKLELNRTKDYYSETLIYSKPGEFKEIKGYKDLIEKGIIEYFVQYKTSGMEIGEEISSINRVGAFIVKASSREQILKKIKNVIEEIEVFDKNDEPTMRKELYSISSRENK